MTSRDPIFDDSDHEGIELPNQPYEPISDKPSSQANERPKPSLWMKVERLPGDRSRVRVEQGALAHLDQLNLKSDKQREMFAEACDRKQPGCYADILLRLEQEARQSSTRYDARHDDACQFVFTSADKFLPEPVDWLWEKYIPAGAVTILEGDPGVGKSLVLADLAARVSRGFLAPDRNNAFDEPGHDPEANPELVWWFAGQDRISQTLTPRLRAAGADMPMIKIIEGTEDRKTEKCRQVAFPQDFHSLWNARAAAPRLVIVDPLASFCGGSLNHQTALKAIAELNKFATETNAAVVVVRSLNRRLGATASQRGSAGPTLTAEARSALLLAQHPEDPTKQVLAVVKSNLCAKAPSLELQIVGRPCEENLPPCGGGGELASRWGVPSNNQGVSEEESFRGAKGDDVLANDGSSELAAPQIAWLGKSSFEADELLQPTRTARPQPSHFEQKKVEEWLNEKLLKGPKLQKEIDEQAALDEVPPILLRRAKISLNIHAVGRNGSTTWSLPDLSSEFSVRSSECGEEERASEAPVAPVGWDDAASPTTNASMDESQATASDVALVRSAARRSRKTTRSVGGRTSVEESAKASQSLVRPRTKAQRPNNAHTRPEPVPPEASKAGSQTLVRPRKKARSPNSAFARPEPVPQGESKACSKTVVRRRKGSRQ